MTQNVLITGTGRPYALGFNLVKRYLENGDRVFASVRQPSEALEDLKKGYPGCLHVLTMDIASTESVNAAARETEALVSHIDLIINNATTASADTMKELPDFDLDLVAPAVNIGAVGPIRVVKAFLPLLKKGFEYFFEHLPERDPMKTEYLLPMFINKLVEREKASVKVLPTDDSWFGVTYREDHPAVVDSFRRLIEAGEYREDLYSDL